MVEQDVRQGRLAFGCVEGGKIDARIRKGLVGRCEEGEGSSALQGVEQVRLDDRGYEAAVDARALRGAGQVVGRVRGREHLVDDVNDAVAGRHVCEGDVCIVDHDAIADGERERLAVGGVGGHAFRDVGRRHAGADHVVEQDVRQRRLALRRVEGSQVDAGIREGLVGRCEDREGAVALQGGEQFGLDHRGHEAVVDAGALGGARDVVGGRGGRQHLVDDVDDAVAGGHVRGGHGGAVHHHSIAHGEAERVAVDGRRRHAVGHVGRRHVRPDDVVQQDVGQGALAFRRVEGCEIDASVRKGLVGGSEDGERTVAL